MKLKARDFLAVLKKAFRSWLKNDPVRESSVIAFYSVFSIPALLVLVINVAALVYEREQIREVLSRQIENAISEKTAESILSAVDSATEFDKGWISTVIGVVVILVGAVRIFIHLRKSFDEIWAVEASKESFFSEMIKVVFSVGMVLCLGFLLLLSMVVTTVLAAASDWLQQYLPDFIVYVFFVMEFGLSLLLIGALFALMYRYLPDKRPAWPAVNRGAILTAVLFMLLKKLLSYLFSEINPASTYGAAGYIILVLIWMSVVSMTLFFGARFIRQYEIYYEKSNQG